MAGIEIYAPRAESHRRTWSLASAVLIIVFMGIGGFLGYKVWEGIKLTGLIPKDEWIKTFAQLVFFFGGFHTCFVPMG